MNNKNLQDLKKTHVDLLVKNILDYGDDSTKNSLIQLLVDKLNKPNLMDLNTKDITKNNFVNQNPFNQLQTQQISSNINQVNGDLNNIKNIMQNQGNQTSPYKMLQSIDPYQSHEINNNSSDNPLTEVYGHQTGQINNQSNNHLNNMNSNSNINNIDAKDESNSFFDPLSI